MLIVDNPYVSELLQETAIVNNFEILNNTKKGSITLKPELNYITSDNAANLIKNNPNHKIYCNSENSINWINENLKFTDLPDKITLFKDKVKFRQILKEIYPDFYFEEVNYDELESIQTNELKFPFIIKPAVGFLSIGVHVVNSEHEWKNTIKELKEEIEATKNLFPKEVVDTKNFIIEEIIEGDEYAIDAYFDENGSPVILNILKHPFSSGKDVSDRLYYTSKKIIQDNFIKTEKLLEEIGKITKIKNFPMHIEVRIEEENIIPIEVNPMRFAGWCCTDLAYFAYGINIYEYFLHQKKPNWEEIFNKVDDSEFYFNIADIPATTEKRPIKNFDYNGYLSNFSNVIEVRKIDFNKNPLFGIFFGSTPSHDEIKKLLTIDIPKYIKY